MKPECGKGVGKIKDEEHELRFVKYFYDGVTSCVFMTNDLLYDDIYEVWAASLWGL